MTTVQAETTRAQEAAKTAIPTGTWKSDPVHSHVGFAVKHMVVATFRGTFTDFDVTLANQGDEPGLYGVIGTDSVQVRDENLKGHLLSPDFFDAERFPEITFTSTQIRAQGDELVVDGDLTIKGTTKRVEARGRINGPAAHPAGGERIGIDLETQVDRTEFGLNWNAPVPSGGVAVADEVTLTVHLELAKED
ncbi:MAG: YceI family protein [Actinomycetota bacterium]